MHTYLSEDAQQFFVTKVKMSGSADLDSPAARRELAKEDVEALEWVLAQVATASSGHSS